MRITPKAFLGSYYLRVWAIIFLGNLISCGPPQTRLNGNWVIVSYQDNGKDQLPLIQELKFGSMISINFPERDEKDGNWGVSTFVRDTIYGFGANLEYNRPVLKCSNMFYFISANTAYIANTSTDPVFKERIPFYLFEGEWKVEKEGSCSLELIRQNDRKVKMVLEKSSMSCR